MNVLIAGSHGLIGTALVEALHARGERVQRLVRRRPVAAGDVFWDPARGEIDRQALSGFDAVVNLAGESIFGVWTKTKKQRIRDSRVLGTRLLATELARLPNPPGVFVCASAVGYYGDGGDDVLAETSSPGDGFLARVVRDWEAAAAAAGEAGIRVVSLRTGIVQTRRGGALKMSLPAFRMGLGTAIGSGEQWYSWITLDDIINAYLFAIDTSSLEGPVNAVAPDPVTNLDYTRTLGRVLHRPTVLRVPRIVGPLLGDLGRELFASVRAVPDELTKAGFDFAHSQLEPALRAALGEPPAEGAPEEERSI